MSEQTKSHTFVNVNGLDKRGRLRLVATKSLVEEIFPDGKLYMGDDADEDMRPALQEFMTDSGRVYLQTEVNPDLKVEVYDIDGTKVGIFPIDSDEFAEACPVNITVLDKHLRARETAREETIEESGRSYKTLPFKVDAILKAVKADARKTGFTFTKKTVSLANRQPAGAVSTGADANADTAKAEAAQQRANQLLRGRR